MLEGGSAGHTGSCLQFPDQLPGIQRIHKVDVAGAAVQDFKRQVTSAEQIQMRRLLVGVTTILQFKSLLIISFNVATQTSGVRRIGVRPEMLYAHRRCRGCNRG